MAHEAEIIVPGSFVVLQGIPGDGLSNSIDSSPVFPYNLEENVVPGGAVGEPTLNSSNNNNVISVPNDNDNMVEYNLDESGGEPTAVPTTPTRDSTASPLSRATAQRSPAPLMMSSTYNSILPPNSPLNSPLNTSIVRPIENDTHTGPEDSFVLVSDAEHATSSSPGSQTTQNHDSDGSNDTNLNLPSHQLSPANQVAISDWETDCRNREVRQRKDWCTLDASLTYHAAEEEEMWWQTEGLIAIFEELPWKGMSTDENNHNATDGVVERHVVGKLAPGSTVVGVQLICLDAKTLERIETTKPSAPTHGSGHATNESPQSRTNVHPRGKKGIVQLLKIESPEVGYIVLSVDGYAFLGPGLPLTYADPQAWVWRVTCPDGAYVREGLELTSHHIETIPFGSFLHVSRKTVNSMGLSRLRIHALLEKDEEDDISRSNATGGASRIGNDDGRERNSSGGHYHRRVVEGWISEALNPLSGQRGPIAQPLPFPVPAVYRVALPSGAIVRSDVELSSTQIGHAPMGSELSIIGRAFSEHPMDQCIERLQLAGHGGWVSVRLNRPPPLDEFVFELIGIDGNFDPISPGLYHFDAYEKVVHEHNNQEVEELLHLREEGNDMIHDLSDIGDGGGGNGSRHIRRSSVVSSVNEDDDDNDDDSLSPASSRSSSPRQTTTTTTVAAEAGSGAIPTLFRSGFAGAANVRSSSVASGSSVGGKPPYPTDDYCLICLTEERNATIVHGETGHIACCLICSRILKARGDKCPVCRLPIDSVIQQFWA